MVTKDFTGTITEKGKITIPAEIRKKYKLRKGSRVRFVETEEGILIVPIIPFEELFGIDKDAKEIIFEMIRELQEERKRQASLE
jgi:AbrB family looped-hinge helix DNA binding protein